METKFWAIVLVLVAGAIGGFGPIYLKKASDNIDIKRISTIYKNWFLITGIVAYGLGTLLFIPALKGGNLSVLYPFVGLSYMWVCLYSVFLLKERMNASKWTGIMIIIIGIILIGVGA